MTAKQALGTLGIVAGGGALPRRIIEACRRDGRDVFVVAIEGHTEAATVDGVDHVWVRLGAASGALGPLRASGVRQLVLAGPIRRPSLAELRPNKQVAKFFAKVGVRAFGDDGLLRAIAQSLEDEGFCIVGVDQVLDDVIAAARCYGQLQPDALAKADIDRGIAVAQALGAVDVGQAVVVQQGLVLGVEAVEGTDALLARCASLKRDGPGGVLVKIKKPGQERRADLPTVGVETLRQAKAAGLRGIVVEAGGALVIDAAAVGATADAEGLFVVGIELPA